MNDKEKKAKESESKIDLIVHILFLFVGITLATKLNPLLFISGFICGWSIMGIIANIKQAPHQ